MRTRYILLAAIGITGFSFFQERVARAETWRWQGAYGGDNRWFTGDGDWAFGMWKDECGQGNTVIAGIAAHRGGGCDYFSCSPEWTDKILCVSPLASVDQSSGYTLTFDNGDDRFDTTWGDWAYGLLKVECASTDVVTGIAQAPGSDAGCVSNSGFTDNVRCSPMIGNKGAQLCATMNFSGGDERETTSRGDWDYGFFKGECGPNRYVKGVALDPNGDYSPIAGCAGRRAEAILCCSPTF